MRAAKWYSCVIQETDLSCLHGFRGSKCTTVSLRSVHDRPRLMCAINACCPISVALPRAFCLPASLILQGKCKHYRIPIRTPVRLSDPHNPGETVYSFYLIF
jgi:hypothetical protein